MPGGMPPIPPPMPGGIPPGGPPAPPPDPPPFDAITSSTLSNIFTASVADLTTCFFTRIGSAIFTFHIVTIFPPRPQHALTRRVSLLLLPSDSLPLEHRRVCRHRSSLLPQVWLDLDLPLRDPSECRRGFRLLPLPVFPCLRYSRFSPREFPFSLELIGLHRQLPSP